MRRASPNPLTARSVIFALRNALKFTAGPNLQRMAGSLTVSAPRPNCFAQHFHAQGENADLLLTVEPDEATQTFASATGARALL